MSQNEPQSITIKSVCDSFLADRRVQGLAPGTVYFYASKLQLFQTFAAANHLALMSAVTADHLRQFLAEIRTTHNPGGVHAAFRAIHALFSWYDVEYEPDQRNPMRKLKAPRVPERLLDPADEKTVDAMIEACDRSSVFGLRDRAILLVLIETGVRAAELCALNRADLNLINSTLLVRQGKGSVMRYVVFGKRSRLALKAYIKRRDDSEPPLFLNRLGERLAYDGLRDLVSRRAADAGVEPPTLHGFRRAFCLRCWRGGMDILTLKRLTGHKSTAVLARYIKYDLTDLRRAVNDLDE